MRRLAAVLLLSLMIVSLVLGFHLMKVTKADSKTIIVPDDYSSIQTAIDNSVSGDTIYVKSGTYMENPILNKSINLIGQDRDSTIIDVTAGLKVQSDNVTITGLTIFDGYQGIIINANNCKISGNKITNSQYGIVLFKSQYCTISENLFQSIGLSTAIQLSYSSNNLLKSNYVNSCTEGIQLRAGSSNNIVTENIITNCQDVAIRLLAEYSPPRWYNPNNNQITLNNISNSGFGTTVYGSSNNLISNNNYINNAVQFSANEEYYLTFGANRSKNTIDENYWSNYNGTDSNNDAIGDTPYIIDAYNQDNHPKMFPISALIELPISNPTPTAPEFSYLTILPILLTTTIGLAIVRKRLQGRVWHKNRLHGKILINKTLSIRKNY